MKGLLGGLGAAARDHQFRALLRLMIFLVAVATLFYRFVEGWRILDAMYFSVITLATIGYGDIAPKTDAGKIFTMAYAIVGIGIFVALVSTLADIVISVRRKSLEDLEQR
ncbi:MAG: potassium channel family protein [Novosphingobium sp.]